MIHIISLDTKPWNVASAGLSSVWVKLRFGAAFYQLIQDRVQGFFFFSVEDQLFTQVFVTIFKPSVVDTMPQEE
jgi:hypothetical protein